ncbi:hypothetical protein DRN67_03700 [Candidatus Micrarchaeota archaeon]|nr:MAG: hypothetical protein DRN67_03700 [Candidatus Micrarchaeota archaeon]
MVRKGQAAMEYLMTYGWAILVIVIVLAALLYLGVFNVGQRVPDQCNFNVGVQCQSPKLTASSLTLTLTNSLGNKINICAITCDDTQTVDGVTPIATTACDAAGEYLATIDVGRSTNVTSASGCTDSSGALGTVGQTYRGKLFLQYMEQGDTGNARIIEGDLLTTVQA